jgi:GTPase KRas protein
MNATRNAAHRFTVLGTGGAGKSALVVQFVHRHYCEIYDPTIEDIYRRQWDVDGQIAVADILDTAGQDEYTALRSTWFVGSDAFVLVYNMCSRTSFTEAQSFLQQIKRHNDDAPTPFMVVATHSDMASERVVSTQEGEELAQQCGQYSGYMEVSSKDRTNIDETFDQAVRLVRRLYEPLEGRDKAKKNKKKEALRNKCTIL